MRGFSLTRSLAAAAAMAVAVGMFAASNVAAAPVLGLGATAGNIDLGSGTPAGGGISANGFLFIPVNTTSGSGAGNCGDVGGTCLQFNQNATTTMTTDPAGGVFSLTGLSFVLDGQQAELGVISIGISGSSLIVSADVNPNNPNQTCSATATFCVSQNTWYNILLNGTADNVTEILFDNLGQGNVRIGGISATVIPLPAAAWLLLGGIGGLGLISRRRKTPAA